MPKPKFLDELKIRRNGLTQRLESLTYLFSERPSAVVLPFENYNLHFTNPDFAEIRRQCLEMTDFVFPSFDQQVMESKVSNTIPVVITVLCIFT